MGKNFKVADYHKMPIGLKWGCAQFSGYISHVVYQSEKEVYTSGCADDGCRAQLIVIPDINDILPADARPVMHYGSYGGPNPFQVSELDNVTWPIPFRGAIILGQMDSKPVIHVRPYTFMMLFYSDAPTAIVAKDAAEEENEEMADKVACVVIEEEKAKETDPLTDIERKVMYVMGCIKAGKYRQDELGKIADRPIITKILADLMLKGFLKASRNGAISMTTAGKQTRKALPGYDRW